MSTGRQPDSSGDNGTALEVHPLTPDRWDDLIALFGDRGAYSGCWSMWWRQTQAEFARNAGSGNRAAFKTIVDQGRVPGLLAYCAGQPVGWCSVAPREEFGRLERSPTLRRVDDQPVWSVVCFYIDRKHRRQGIATTLLRAAVRYAVEQGAQIVEGYPVDADPGRVGVAAVYTGTPAMYRDAGFKEVARRSKGRPIMRYVATDRSGG